MNQLRAQGHGMECWMDDRGLWTWGFTDKFAVYDNQTWQYESDQKNGDNRTLVLRNGDERLRADFQLTSDSTCTIAVEGRENPKLRQGLCPKRFWPLMTELAEEEGSAGKRRG